MGMKVPRAKTVNPAFDLQNHAANLAARDARAGQREKTIARLRAKLEKKDPPDPDVTVDVTTSLSDKENVHVDPASTTDVKKKARKIKKRRTARRDARAEHGELLFLSRACENVHLNEEKVESERELLTGDDNANLASIQQGELSGSLPAVCAL